MFQKQLDKKPLLQRNREPIDLNQPEPGQIENAEQKVRLNSNQRPIQPLANICLNPIASKFKILTTAHSQFHLSLLEAVYISRKKNRSVQAKQFVFTLQLFC